MLLHLVSSCTGVSPSPGCASQGGRGVPTGRTVKRELNVTDSNGFSTEPLSYTSFVSPLNQHVPDCAPAAITPNLPAASAARERQSTAPLATGVSFTFRPWPCSVILLSLTPRSRGSLHNRLATQRSNAPTSSTSRPARQRPPRRCLCCSTSTARPRPPRPISRPTPQLPSARASRSSPARASVGTAILIPAPPTAHVTTRHRSAMFVLPWRVRISHGGTIAMDKAMTTTTQHRGLCPPHTHTRAQLDMQSACL